MNKKKVIATLLTGLVFISSMPLGVSADINPNKKADMNGNTSAVRSVCRAKTGIVATWGTEKITDSELELELINQKNEFFSTYGEGSIKITDKELYEKQLDIALENIAKRNVLKKIAKELGVTPTELEIINKMKEFQTALAVRCKYIKEGQILDGKTQSANKTGLEKECKKLYRMSITQYQEYYVMNNLYYFKLREKIKPQLDEKIAVLYPLTISRYNDSRVEDEKSDARLAEIEKEEAELMKNQECISDEDRDRYNQLNLESLQISEDRALKNFQALNSVDKMVDKEFANLLFNKVRQTVNTTNERKWLAQINLNTEGLNETQTADVRSVAGEILTQVKAGNSIIAVAEELKQHLLKANYKDEDQIATATRILDSLRLCSGYAVYEKNKSPLIPELENDVDKSNHLIPEIIALPQGYSVTVVLGTVAANETVPMDYIKMDNRFYEALRDSVYGQILKNGSEKQMIIQSGTEIDFLINRMISKKQ